MFSSTGSRWVARVVVGVGFLLAAHLLIVAFVLPPSDAASQRPWPLSLEFSFLGSSSGGSSNKEGDGTAVTDGIHNFGAPQDEATAPPGNPWYPPRASQLNNLTAALSPSASGVYGFLFNGSATPDGAYGVYNWCNMPHVRRAEYPVVLSPAAAGPDQKRSRTLVYVEVLHRHHKRTPYAANSFPHEPYPWECGDARVHLYGELTGGDPREEEQPGSAYYAPTFDTPANPFLAAAPGWHGSCQFPQLTAGGLADAWQHGADLYGVYHDLLGFLPAMDDAAAWRDQVAFRVTNNPLTSQTASMVLGGMMAAVRGGGGERGDGSIIPATPLSVEPPSFDSLEPQYSCPAAANLFSVITGDVTPAWAEHLERLAPLFAQLDEASGVDPADPRGFHVSVDHYYDNLSARQCHGKAAVAGIPQNVADTVFRVGQWEYSRMYRDDARSLAASASAWGVWVAQLAGHLRAASTATEDNKGTGIRYRHNVAHDGSVSRLLSILQADEMVWPGMGSEIVVELWKEEEEEEETKTDTNTETERKTTASSYAVRVLFGGRLLRSSHPELGILDMLPLDVLLNYIDGLVGPDASLLPAKCNGTRPL